MDEPKRLPLAMAIMPQNAVDRVICTEPEIFLQGSFAKKLQFTMDLHEWLQHGQILQHQQHNVPDSSEIT